MGTGPLSPNIEHGARHGSLPAYVGNGLVGLRVREVPLLSGSAIVNGTVGLHPKKRIEAAVAIPYPLAGDIGIDEAWLSEQPWAVTNLQQRYDFGTAELTSSFDFTAHEITLHVEIATFASRSEPSLVLQELVVRSSADCALKMRASVDARDVRGAIERRRVLGAQEDSTADGSLLWVTEGRLGSCGIAIHSECNGADPVRHLRPADRHGPLTTEHHVPLRAERPVRLLQMAALVPSIVHGRPDEEAVRRLARGTKLGFDALRQRNRAIWEDLWQARIVVNGADDRHQRVIDAGFFYMNCSAHIGSPAATSMFGLAHWHNYHYYYGHVMWDIDAFCVPPLLLLQPSAAHSLVDFRARHLDVARRYAQQDGYVGMRFPWQAAPLSGEEATPGDGPGAAYEAHISLHVARAFALHAAATGDKRFLQEFGWPAICGVIRWLEGRLILTDRGAELKAATGPAEVEEPPDNDAFTLMAAHDLLDRAIRLGEHYGWDTPASWRDLKQSLYLPERSDDVIPTHEGFHVNEPKGATPSPLAGLFPLDYPMTERQRAATLTFFLARWRDYIGSPMLPAFYPTWAAMSGDRDLALTLFDEGYGDYHFGRFFQCLEYRADHPDSETPAGPFMANIGAMLTGLLFGMTGLRMTEGDPSSWPCRRVSLPQGWTDITVERLWIRGRPMKLIARHGAERAELLALDI
jgi:trehalose/maltose hydrolase-like predicted phosphorylase